MHAHAKTHARALKANAIKGGETTTALYHCKFLRSSSKLLLSLYHVFISKNNAKSSI